MLSALYMIASTCAIIALFFYIRVLDRRVESLKEDIFLLTVRDRFKEILTRTKDPKKLQKELEKEFGEGCVQVTKIKGNKRGKK